MLQWLANIEPFWFYIFILLIMEFYYLIQVEIKMVKFRREEKIKALLGLQAKAKVSEISEWARDKKEITAVVKEILLLDAKHHNYNLTETTANLITIDALKEMDFEEVDESETIDNFDI